MVHSGVQDISNGFLSEHVVVVVGVGLTVRIGGAGRSSGRRRHEGQERH